MTLDVDLEHLAEVVFVRLLYSKVTPSLLPLCMPYSLEGSHFV